MIFFLYPFSFLSLCLVSFKIYWKLSTKWNASYTCLVGKTAIVTGANTGLGYITALDLAKRGAKVILACRNKDRAEDAQRKIIKATGNPNIVVKLVDVASLQSVRDFAEDINKTEERLDILVNNAGLGFMEKDYTADGIQFLLHVNHIGPFLLTHLLIDKLKKSAPSRIINVSSIAALHANLNTRNLGKINEVLPVRIGKVYRDSVLYGNTKLCNILFTTELAKKLHDTGVTVNALHPGVIPTEFFRGLSGILKVIFEVVAKKLLISPEEGAQTQIYLSVSKDVEGVTGGFFTNCCQAGLYSRAKNPELAKKLWEKSEELAKLHPNERIP